MTISIGGFAACVLAAFIVGGVVGLLLACVVMSGRDDNDDWDGVDE